MNGTNYIEDLKSALLSLYEDLTQYDEKMVYQDDSAPCHRAKIVGNLVCLTNFKKGILNVVLQVTHFEEEIGLTVMKWPGNSPDMNPIEHVWYEIKKKLADFKPENKNQLISDVYKSWDEVLASDYVKNLYMTMPNRIRALIKAKGGVTKY